MVAPECGGAPAEHPSALGAVGMLMSHGQAPGMVCRVCTADKLGGRAACLQCGAKFSCNVPVRPPSGPVSGRHPEWSHDAEAAQSVHDAHTVSHPAPARQQSPSVARQLVRNASSVCALPNEHFTKVPPWRKMGLQIEIEKKALRRPEAAYQPGAGEREPTAEPPAAASGACARANAQNQFSKRARGSGRDGQEADRRASAAAVRAPAERDGNGRAGRAGDAGLLAPIAARGEHKPEQTKVNDTTLHPPSRSSAGPCESKHRAPGAKSPGLERMLARMEVREHSSSDEMVNLDAPGQRFSSSEDELQAESSSDRRRIQRAGETKEAPAPVDVALTVLPEVDEANDNGTPGEARAGEAPSRCHDRILMVALQSTSILAWVCAARITLPAAAFWVVLSVLLIVHAVEGYCSESVAHLRTVISHADAVALLRRLQAAQPALVFRLGNATSRLAFSRWDDSSPDQPVLAKTCMIHLKVLSGFSVDDEVALETQRRRFRTVQCRDADDSNDLLQEQLVIEGFSDYTHSGPRSMPVMRVLVAPAGKAHPLANMWCFWLCHMSVVFALPYRYWLSSVSARVTHVVSKRFVC